MLVCACSFSVPLHRLFVCVLLFFLRFVGGASIMFVCCLFVCVCSCFVRSVFVFGCLWFVCFCLLALLHVVCSFCLCGMSLIVLLCMGFIGLLLVCS